MTGVFNIDLQSDGFRKNNLDWSRFRQDYNRVSATKLERGIKPLPFSLLLKLVGPQKVFNTYVPSHRTTDDQDYLPIIDVNVSDREMRNTDMTVTKTVEFPGTGLLNVNDTYNVGSSSKGTKQLKRDGLPVRPAFQRGIRVPGRYFPKPSSSIDDTLSQSSMRDFSKLRQKTQTPRSVHTYTPHQMFRGAKVHLNQGFKTPSFIRSNNSRNGDTISPTTGRAPQWSGVSGSTNGSIHSMHVTNTNGHSVVGSSLNGSKDTTGGAQFMLYKQDDNDPSRNGKREFELNGDTQSEVLTVNKINHNVRHVTFPKTSVDFSTVLQGRPKTLHRRDPAEEWAREPRARTHVGFAMRDT